MVGVSTTRLKGVGMGLNGGCVDNPLQLLIISLRQLSCSALSPKTPGESPDSVAIDPCPKPGQLCHIQLCLSILGRSQTLFVGSPVDQVNC